MADEGVDTQIVVALREAGHDVRYIAEDSAGITDKMVLGYAKAEGRISDNTRQRFWRVDLPRKNGSYGIILNRLFALSSIHKARLVVSVIEEFGLNLKRSFTVIQPGSVRIRKLKIEVADPPEDMTGYSKTPLLKKLGIKTGFRVLLIHAPAHFLELLGPLPEDAVLVQKEAQNLDVIVFFTEHRAALEIEFPALANQIKPNGMVWIAWPKKASKVPTDLSFNGVQTWACIMGWWM